MAQFRVGCVPYVNARPLVAAFDQPNEFVEVLYDIPSKLPEMLDSGLVQAILVSSIELLRRDDLLPVTDVGIMSFGPVLSVRMLSKVPIGEIKTLALDRSSMTSNILAQVLLAEQGVFPTADEMSPNVPEMLAHHDACVIIGDRGFEADGQGLFDIDLGAAWTEMTNLPFVWALWLGKKEFAGNLTLFGHLLRSAYLASGFATLHGGLSAEMNPIDNHKAARRDHVIRLAMQRSTWSYEQVENYLTHGVRFEHAQAIDALREFGRLIQKHGLADVNLPLELRPADLQKSVDALIPLTHTAESLAP